MDPDDPDGGDPLIVCLHPALVPAFKAWLAGRGARLGRLPGHLALRDSHGPVPTWIVTPTDAAWREGPAG